MASKNNGKAANLEKTLFKAADKLRKNIDVDEYLPLSLCLVLRACNNV